MRKNTKKAVLALAALTVAFSAASCGKKDNGGLTSGKEKVTWWVELNANTAQTASNLSETKFSKKLMEKFNVDIEYQHPAQGQAAEKFNIMIATGDLPDIIEYGWNYYSGGAPKALQDGVIQEIDIEKDAPSLFNYIKDNDAVKKQMMTDDGKYYGYPFIRGDRSLQTSAGIMLRADWLSDLNLPVPETIDEWTKTLKEFKDKKGAKAPLDMATYQLAFNGFIGAYGVSDDIYIDDDGKVCYGPCQKGYKDFLIQMNKWYSDGLINSDFVSLDGSIIQSNILNGVSGAALGSVGGNMGKWLAAKPDDKFDLVAAPYPVLNKGDKPQFGQLQNSVTGTFATISRDCKNAELCKKILDYGYTDEGHMLYNFGIEGESYEMKDGNPVFTDLITNNSEGLSMSAALAKYALSHTEGPFVQDKRYMEQYASLPQQQEAIEKWSDTEMEKHLLPNITLLPDEAKAMATKLENIKTYKDEMLAKFIMGLEPIDNFDSFAEELKKRGADEYVKMMQDAYDRYNKR